MALHPALKPLIFAKIITDANEKALKTGSKGNLGVGSGFVVAEVVKQG
jgi:hypothetical protein